MDLVVKVISKRPFLSELVKYLTITLPRLPEAFVTFVSSCHGILHDLIDAHAHKDNFLRHRDNEYRENWRVYQRRLGELSGTVRVLVEKFFDFRRCFAIYIAPLECAPMLSGQMNDGVEWGPRIHHEFVAYVGRRWL